MLGEMFSEIDLSTSSSGCKCAFDAQGLLNPGKVFPTLHRWWPSSAASMSMAASSRFQIFPGSEHYQTSPIFDRHTPRMRGIQHSAPPTIIRGACDYWIVRVRGR